MKRKMSKNLIIPLRINLTKVDELHISEPPSVEGWSITHLGATEV